MTAPMVGGYSLVIRSSPRVPTRMSPIRFAHVAVGALTLSGALACSPSRATGPTPLGTSVPLRVGETYVPVPGGALQLTLLSVDSDSRCPASVMCIWAGEARVTVGVRLGMGPTVPTPFIAGVAAPPVDAGGLRVRVDSLTPYPAVPAPLAPQSHYTAWLTATATP